jgi:hypothetical protein
MNRPVGEVRRLRAELAEKDRELAELRGLVARHIDATAGDEQRCLERERAAYERGRDFTQLEYRDGFNLGHDVALCAHEEARPFVAGVREGFADGYQAYQEIAEKAFSAVHQCSERQVPEPDLELGA